MTELGVRCDVVAPSMIPRRRGDHIKTHKRDTRALAGLHRAGQLVATRVPTVSEEAVRDLCRTKLDRANRSMRSGRDASRVSDLIATSFHPDHHRSAAIPSTIRSSSISTVFPRRPFVASRTSAIS
jgi:transposase